MCIYTEGETGFIAVTLWLLEAEATWVACSQFEETVVCCASISSAGQSLARHLRELGLKNVSAVFFIIFYESVFSRSPSRV